VKPSDITPVILTFNEAPNIGRMLQRLSWAKEILIIDSFSTDETLNIARSFPSVRILQRKFDTFAGQCNFGLEHVTSPWVLSLDADYLLSDDLVRELELLAPDGETAGYRAAFKYCIGGQPLRGTLYPPRAVLYRRGKARYRDEGHGHRVHIDGVVESLRSPIYHDDRKPLRRWLVEQNRYMIAESRYLLRTPASELSVQDRLRRWIVIAPAVVFVYTLLAKGLIFDGWRGWFYVAQRTFAEMLLSFRLAEARIQGTK
jgi:glycosyltransferase involved in cell wall biosynthesis